MQQDLLSMLMTGMCPVSGVVLVMSTMMLVVSTMFIRRGR